MTHRLRTFFTIFVLLAALAGLSGCNPRETVPNGDAPRATPPSPIRPTP